MKWTMKNPPLTSGIMLEDPIKKNFRSVYYWQSRFLHGKSNSQFNKLKERVRINYIQAEVVEKMEIRFIIKCKSQTEHKMSTLNIKISAKRSLFFCSRWRGWSADTSEIIVICTLAILIFSSIYWHQNNKINQMKHRKQLKLSVLKSSKEKTLKFADKFKKQPLFGR